MNGNLILVVEKGKGLRIGRSIRVTVLSVSDSEAVIAVSAPRREAVSRDSYSHEVHMEFQKAAEDGQRIEPAEAVARAARAG